ncbi:NAD-dependent epimerase/dehydratase family protein [Nakamurella flava]|uniref:NAD-dependent epimerase/dehydratase family protein n=1 Tax=Nakamurella flava TaxID=2576308 RepID=A0A4U6QEL5_9ACTN|nr:NAD-dependent epimerase/dehydratase family protein [Nakamurella flava]TKV58687.1 NAD-dependent epimerase/dehydratase family protein [Nakamurella flava]
MDMTQYVVAGAGPVGTTVARQLATAGHHVRLLTRSGRGPDHPSIERVATDISRVDDLTAQLDGSAAIFSCIHASRYAAATWRAELPAADAAVLTAAGRVGATAVFPESLYGFGPVDGPMTERTPLAATTGKPGIRVELLHARAASPTRTISVAASDFYGPEVLTAHAGERMVARVLAGRSVQVIGSADQPHSFTYVPDLAAAMIAAAGRPGPDDEFLLAPTAPAITQRALVGLFAAAADVAAPRVGRLPVGLLRAVGVVHGGSRELAELGYQFTAPFVLDSRSSERILGLAATPLGEGVRATVQWWRQRLSTAPGATADVDHVGRR